jgi:rod shape-determining protein MreC
MIGGHRTSRRRIPRWASTIAVVATAAAMLAPGPWRSLEKVGTTVLAPIQMGLSGTMNEVASVFDALQRVRHLTEENAQFREDIDRLQSQLVRMRELERENDELRNLLGVAQGGGPGSYIPVAVIARDDSPYVQAITVDRGVNGGVHEGSIVITHKGLVGRVERANPTSAKVRLITDLNSSVAVRLQTESRATGVLRGQAQGDVLVMDYIPRDDPVNEGDLVITSGLGETFPDGLPVGKVSRVQRKDADLFQAAAVEPAVDMNKLERLYVLADR